MNSITIMGREVKIIKKKMDDLHGEFNGDKNTIYISNKLKDKELEDTILHEAIHAVFFYSGLNELLAEDKEEAIVRCLEYNFLPIVRNILNNS